GGSHPDSASFPTRRSSDLGQQLLQSLRPVRRARGVAPPGAPSVALAHGGPVGVLPEVAGRVGVAEVVDKQHRENDQPAEHVEREDRKSTRLNSSHRTISYA